MDYRQPGPTIRTVLGVNPLCPDYMSHAENAADRIAPDGVVDAETSALIDAEAEAEYLACEGH